MWCLMINLFFVVLVNSISNKFMHNLIMVMLPMEFTKLSQAHSISPIQILLVCHATILFKVIYMGFKM